MRVLLKLMLALILLLASLAHGYTLTELEAQLRAAKVVRGEFVQEKFLRSLPRPLTSRGHFILASGKGLLWSLRKPFAQDLRITEQGISRRDRGGNWTPVAQQAFASRESRLFLAVLAGDTHELQASFDITLSGTPQSWHMELTPVSALLSQVFNRISIEGGATVTQIELLEAQGDKTVLHLQHTQIDQTLSAEETLAYAD